MGSSVISKDYIEGELKRYKVPGIGIGVIKDGKVILKEGFGFKNLAKKSLVTPLTQFGIASCSKSFTSTLIGMLADDGYFGLEQPIKEYLPDFEMYDSVATAECTLKDMLTHNTGLGGHDALWVDNITRADLWNRLRYLEPNKPFRSTVQYNNLIYTIAGHIAEKVTGKTWDKLIEERIFKPLEMNNSNTSITKMVLAKDFATPYWQSESGPFEIDNWNVDLGGPAASINSCVDDMLKWLQFHIDEGVTQSKNGKEGKRLIKKETLDEMHKTQVPYTLWPWDFDELPPTGGYGMAWFTDVYRGEAMYFHVGEIEGYTAMEVVIPKQHLGIIILNNIHKPATLIQQSITYTIIDNVLGLTPEDWSTRFYNERNNYGHMLEDWNNNLMPGKPVSGTLPSHAISEYFGKYFNPGYGDINIDIINGQLKCIYRGVEEKMEHYHYDVFKVPNIKMDTLLVTSPLSFIVNPLTGEIDRFEFQLVDGIAPITFIRKK